MKSNVSYNYVIEYMNVTRKKLGQDRLVKCDHVIPYVEFFFGFALSHSICFGKNM